MKKAKYTIIAALALAAPATAQDSGSYLALRYAFHNSDDQAVHKYLDVELQRFPDNAILLEEAILAAIYRLDLDAAHRFATDLKKEKSQSLAVEIVEFAKLVKDGEFDKAHDYLKAGTQLGYISPDILKAWALVDAGQVDEALAFLETTADGQGELGFVFDFQRAMIEAYANQDYLKAAEILGNKGKAIYMSDLSFYSHLALLKLGGSPVFDALVSGQYGPKDNWPGFVQKLTAIAEKGKIDPSFNFASPQNAIGEYLMALLNASEDQRIDYGLERMLEGVPTAISPENMWFLRDYMGYFERRKEYEDVIEFAERSDPNSFLYEPNLQMRINALFSLEKTDEILKWLEDADASAPDERAFIADSYRRLELYEEAIEHFNTALAGMEDLTENAAYSVFALAVCHERIGDWEKAEPNFLKAIELSPEAPEFLNYLGYSYVDRGEKLDIGLDMIKKAAELAPNSGHIIDSLGWAYYRLERYEEALDPLEKATTMMSTDAVVNAHLGDLYWQLGRKREARFQWERAMRFLKEDSKDLTSAQLQERLEVGLIK